MILTLNSAGRVMNINESGRRILDCESSEVLGRDWFYTFVPIDLQAAAWASFHSDMEHPFDGIRQFESPVVTRQGGTRMISWRAVIPRNSEGVPTSMLYSGDDITEKRDAERNFRELSFRNETILNSAGDGLYGIDRNGLTTFINPAGAEMVGYKPEYLIGQPIHNLIHHTDQNGSPYPASASPILRAARGGDSQKKSNEVFWRSDESSFPVEYTATPILGENGPSGAVVVFRDVTEQRDLQAKLIQSSKLATLGEMATGVAHELNQPMNIIGMAAASITRKLDKGGIDEEYTRKKLDKIIAQTRRAAEIIDHMRIFGRPAINDPVALHVPDIAKSALDLVSEQLRLASIDVTFEPLDSCGAVLA